MMRLDGVEIKVSLAGPSVADALEKLDVDRHDETPRRRGVGFIEDISPRSDLPLFHCGVVLRVRRAIDTDDEGDSTIKLRPCRRRQLHASWRDATKGKDWELKVEEDWAGPRRVLAVSCCSNLPTARVDAVLDGSEGISHLFEKRQEAFLRECCEPPPGLDGLTLLPLIESTRWDEVPVGSVEKVVVERWRIDDLDFLELSARADDRDQAAELQEDLQRAVDDLALASDDAEESKTARVLAHLVERARHT